MSQFWCWWTTSYPNTTFRQKGIHFPEGCLNIDLDFYFIKKIGYSSIWEEGVFLVVVGLATTLEDKMALSS